MILIKKFFTILIVLFTFISNSNSQDLIVYLDLDNVVSNSKAGKLILEKLDKSKKSALLKFEKKEAIQKTILDSSDEINQLKESTQKLRDELETIIKKLK